MGEANVARVGAERNLSFECHRKRGRRERNISAVLLLRRSPVEGWCALAETATALHNACREQRDLRHTGKARDQNLQLSTVALRQQGIGGLLWARVQDLTGVIIKVMPSIPHLAELKESIGLGWNVIDILSLCLLSWFPGLGNKSRNRPEPWRKILVPVPVPVPVPVSLPSRHVETSTIVLPASTIDSSPCWQISVH